MKFIKRNNRNVEEKFNAINGKTIKPINPIVLKTIVERGIDTLDEVNKFIVPSYEDLHDPFLFKDMNKAVQRIRTAIQNGEQITIWGDYDVDGVTSSSALLMTLKRMGANVTVYIPDRKTEGYGLNREGLEKIMNMVDLKLLITVDCGITSKEIVEELEQKGVDVIITDHHEVPEDLPVCHAVINPKNPNDNYPFKDLAGVGVVGKLIQALAGVETLKEYIDLIAFGTVCDVMPLVGENRIFVHHGLKHINETPRPQMKIFAQKAFSEAKYTTDVIKASHLGFNLGPMINSQGRLGHSKYSVMMFTDDDLTKTEQIADMLFNINKARKEIETEAIKRFEAKVDVNNLDNILIFYEENLEVGIAGLIASRIVEKFNRPTIILSYDPENNYYSGSARSIEGIDLHSELTKVEILFDKWGGHSAAAGLSFYGYNFEMIKAILKDNLSQYPEETFVKRVRYDSIIEVEDITQDLIDSAEILEPCGVGNPKMIYMTKDAILESPMAMGGNREHYRGILRKMDSKVRVVAFNQLIPQERIGVKAVYSLGMNQYKDYTPTIQAQIIALVPDDSEEDPIQYNAKQEGMELEHFDVSPAKMKQFEERGIVDAQTLINYIPSRYKDYSTLYTVKDIVQNNITDQDLAITGYIDSTYTNGKILIAFCRDVEGNTFNAKWFNQAFRKTSLDAYRSQNKLVLFCGTVKPGSKGTVDIFPEIYSDKIEMYQRLTPIYKKVPGMSDQYLTNKMQLAYSSLQNKDYLSKEIIEDFDLLTTLEKAKAIHFPKSLKDVEKAQKRLLFDDLFKFNLSLKLNHKPNFKSSEFLFDNFDATERLIDSLPYTLTNDQMKTYKGIVEEVNKNKKPLNGLIQGDVGSGKTIIAFLMMTLAYDNGFQGVLIAPTEVLAKQHYEDMLKTLKPLGINVAYLYGGIRAKQRREILKGLKDGSIDVAIGTSALIQDTVDYYNLGMVVVDEQHRFGVAQREKLLDRKNVPHSIVMSATPIPRTLSMALFGDTLSVYNIKEKPAGRKDIITEVVESDEELNERMYQEISKGHQCYVICPLINKSKSDKMKGVRSLEQEVVATKKYFKKHHPEVVVAELNGKMKTEEMDQIIKDFADNKIHILMSTTVIEVGINVPNATIIAIKSSERFGLAQAHQLRGRVGRSNIQSYCLLQTDPEEEKAQILVNTSDGFEVAKADLELRGAGDYLGTQQKGSNNLVMLMLKYPDLYEKIDKLNQEIIKDSKKVDMYKYLLDIEI